MLLLASMKDEEGRTIVEGFYDGITISPQDQRVLDSVPDDEEALMKSLGIAEPDKVGRTLQEARQYPSLNIRGLRSAWVGSEVRTIVPDQAVAEIDVPDERKPEGRARARRYARHSRANCL